MNLEPAPRLSKTTFFLIDAGLLLTAFLIVFFNSKNPYAPLPFVSAVVCVVLAAIIGLVPFLIDYAADSAEYVQQERLRVNEQVQRLQGAAESLARAAAQIKAVEEAVHKTAHAAEHLPYRMQEKLAEFNEALAEKESADHEALEQELVELRAAQSEQLKAVADKIAKTTAELAALEVSARRQLAAAEAAAAKVPQAATAAAEQLETKLTRALTALDTKLAALAHTSVQPAPPAPVAALYERREEPAPAGDGGHRPPLQEAIPTLAAHESVSPTAPAATPTDEDAKPKKPRAPRKPKPEEMLMAMSEPATTSGPSEESAPPTVASETPAIEPEPTPTASSEEPAEAAASSDGATRLLATAYIGIGNKLYIRGDGPGLSRDKGVPMQFVSIGKWGWATHDATAPVRCTLYKNDDTAALTGEVTLEPGKHVEVTALF